MGWGGQQNSKMTVFPLPPGHKERGRPFPSRPEVPGCPPEPLRGPPLTTPWGQIQRWGEGPRAKVIKDSSEPAECPHFVRTGQLGGWRAGHSSTQETWQRGAESGSQQGCPAGSR